MIDSYQQVNVESRGWKEFSRFWADMEQEMTGQLQHALEKPLVLVQQDYLASSYRERTVRRSDYRNGCYRRKQEVPPVGTLNPVRVPRCRHRVFVRSLKGILPGAWSN